jgi:hypothetical protein
VKETDVEELRHGYKKQLFRLFRLVAIPIALYAIITVVDSTLPRKHVEEIAEYGWQEKNGLPSKRHDAEGHKSFMKTKSFQFEVPNEVHIAYDYTIDPRALSLYVTPIFGRVHRAELKTETGVASWNTRPGIVIILEYILLTSSVVALFVKKYSKLNYGLSLVPIITVTVLIAVSLM